MNIAVFKNYKKLGIYDLQRQVIRNYLHAMCLMDIKEKENTPRVS